MASWPPAELGRWKAKDGMPPGPLWTKGTGPVAEFEDVDTEWETETFLPVSALQEVVEDIERRSTQAAEAAEGQFGDEHDIPIGESQGLAIAANVLRNRLLDPVATQGESRG